MQIYEDNNENYDYIVCPLCNKHVQRMKSHLMKTHNLSWDEFHSEYPDVPHISGRFLKNRQDLMIKKHQDPEFKKKIAYANAHPSDKKLKSCIKNLNKINGPDRNPEWNKQASIRMTNYNKSDKHKEVVRQMMLKRHEDPSYTNSLARHGRIGNRVKMTLPNGRSINTRSSVEATIIEELSKITSDFDYECVSIKYEYQGNIHNYIPDILLGKDTIIEVKPKSYWNDEINQCKKKACEDKGYKFFFVFSVDDLHKIIK